jgi:hypothetical protein
MLHLHAQPSVDRNAEPYAEAVSRLAGVRHALRLVDSFGGGPASDPGDEVIACAWDNADAAQRTWFDTRSARMVSATAAGVETLLLERQAGREPHEEASQLLVDQIRRELHDVARVILG